MLMIAFVALAGLVVVSGVETGNCNSCLTSNDYKANTTCASLKGYLNCLETHDASPCNHSAADASPVKGITACDADDDYKNSACKCQHTFWSSARTDDDTRCTGYNDLLSCLGGKTGKTCGDGAKDDFVKSITTKRDGISTCPKSGAAANVFTATSLVLALLATYIL